MQEIWKDIKGYEGLYQVSNLGRVKRTNPGNRVVSADGTLKPTRRQHGYLGVMLYGKGGHATRGFKHCSVHRLVAEAFIPNPNGYAEVNHIDEDKTNNRVDNLEWVTHQQNCVHGTLPKRKSEWSTNGKQSKAIVQYTLNGEFVARYPSLAEVERQTGFGKGNICRCAQHHHAYSHAYGYVWRYET